MAITARYYDGETALVHDVSVRTTTNELVIFRLADAGILACWPIGELVVLGDVQHEVTPPIVRKGAEARLVVDDPELRRQLAALVPQLAPLAGTRVPPIRRIAAFGATFAVLI